MCKIFNSITRVMLLLTFAIPIVAFAQGENQSYLPLSKTETNKRFPLKFLGKFGPETSTSTFSIGSAKVTLDTIEDTDWLFTGKDKNNKTWHIQTRSYVCGGAGSAFYQADLDKNGLQDLIILAPTCGVGLSPSSHIVVITFESQGRPVLFEADGYFVEEDKGIFDIVDLDGNRKAELIYMNFSDGYWITNLYQVANARWQRIRGQYAGRTYPLFTRFTFKENHKATTPRSGRQPFAPDLSNTVSNLEGNLISYHWAKVNFSEDISLKVSSTGSKQTICKPVSWYSSFSVVVDKKNSRRIFSLSANEKAIRSILDEIVANKYKVKLYGQRRAKECSPELVWVYSR